MKFTTTLFVIILLACTQKENGLINPEISEKSENVINFNLLDNDLSFSDLKNNKYSLKLNDHSQLNSVVNLYKGDNEIQTIKIDKPYEKIQLLDWNNDSVRDLSILINSGATGNTFYQVWLFNDNENVFKKHPSLDNVSVFLDTVKKHVVFHYNEGGGNEIWNYCSFKNNEILLDFSKVIEQGCCINDKRWRKTYSFRLKNNEVDTIQSKIDYFD